MTNTITKKIGGIPKHSILLMGILLFVFVFPLFEKSVLKEFLITVSYTVMILSVASIVEFKRKWLYYLILIATMLQWASYLFRKQHFEALNFISFAFSVALFSIAIYLMIKQIINSKKVDPQLIIETIIGYLLIGVVFTFVNILILAPNPQAIGFNNSNVSLGDIIYYSYITFMTIGYGDISPVTQIARGFAILFGLIGQLYLTIIIAFIIGKYINSKNN